MKRKRYSRKFQRMAVERMRTCESVDELVRELGVRPRCLYKWRAKLEALEPGEEAARPSTHAETEVRSVIQQIAREHRRRYGYRLNAEFVYLAVILDGFSRKVVGWALDRTLGMQLTVGALEQAIERRQPKPGLVHHSDRGLQYARGEYIALLEKYLMIPSMSRPANPYDVGIGSSYHFRAKPEHSGLDRGRRRFSLHRNRLLPLAARNLAPQLVGHSPAGDPNQRAVGVLGQTSAGHCPGTAIMVSCTASSAPEKSRPTVCSSCTTATSFPAVARS